MNNNTSKMIKISLLSALALILMYIDFPVIPLFPWLKIDLSDVPALIGAFGFGPLAGVLIELIKNIVIVLIKGTQTGFVGEIANFLVGVALILPAALVYHKNKSKKNCNFRNDFRCSLYGSSRYYSKCLFLITSLWNANVTSRINEIYYFRIITF